MPSPSTQKAAPSNPAHLALARQANDAGMMSMQRGDFARAMASFLQAAQADPAAGLLWMNLAHAARMAQDWAQEKQALDRALALDQVDFTARLRLAQWHQRAGEESKALVAWHHVQQLAHGRSGLMPAVLQELADGMAYAAALQHKLEQALEQALAQGQDSRSAMQQRRIDAFLGHATGRRQIFANQCEGAHYPFLPADEFFDRDLFPWFDELEAGAQAIAGELAALLAQDDTALRPYVRMGEGAPDTPWAALDNSLDWGACFLYEYGEPQDLVLERCPQTAGLLARLPLAHIPGRAPNAFFSLLRPNSRIPPHTGVTNTRAIVHLALDIPPDCGFRVGGETRQWEQGKAFAFDDTIDHEAWNLSNQRRAILIIDTWNPHLTEAERAAILAYYRAYDAALAGSAP